jgi:hypothetical protein
MKILKEIKTDTAWSKITDVFREKTIFSFLFLSISGPIFIKTNKLFGKVKVRQQLNLVRYSKFDDGWTYQKYWGNESKSWEHVEIIKNK